MNIDRDIELPFTYSENIVRNLIIVIILIIVAIIFDKLFRKKYLN